MPIYTYVCGACSDTVEKFLKMDDYMVPTEEPCRSCNEMRVQKMCDSPPLIDPTKLGRVKIDSDFRGVLEGVKKSTYKSDFDIR